MTFSTLDTFYTVETRVAADDAVEFEAWQVHEHVPALLALDGYFGVRRFKEMSDEPSYLNLWHVDTRERFFSQARSDAVETPWKTRIAPRRSYLSVRFYRLGFSGGSDANFTELSLTDLTMSPQDAIAVTREIAGRGPNTSVECLLSDDDEVPHRLLLATCPERRPWLSHGTMPVRRFRPIRAYQGREI